jgi:antitoxin (DNA-binding transcriptional repressor) of toxin-antitoxin stability system
MSRQKNAPAKTCVLTDDGRPAAETPPIERVRRSRPFGLAGTFVVADDFDAPLPVKGERRSQSVAAAAAIGG